MTEFRTSADGVTFWLRVKPGSRHDRLVRNAAGECSLEVSARAIEGRANEACVEFLARRLGLPRRAIEILAGEKSRRKLFRVVGRSARDLEALFSGSGATALR